MESTCPGCLSQVPHQEQTPEVTCSCGFKFKPNGDLDDLPPLDSVMAVSVSEDVAQEKRESEAESDSETEDSLPETPDGPPSSDSFQESEGVFQELRDFGENLLQSEGEAPQEAPSKVDIPEVAAPETPAVPEGSVSLSVPMTPSTSTSGSVSAPATDVLLTLNESLEGFQIQKYFAPISAQCNLAAGEDPLKEGFQALAKLAKQNGANAVVGIKVTLAADSKSALLTGTAVQAAPKGA